MRANRAAGRGWAAAGAGLCAAVLWCGACAKQLVGPVAGVVGGVLTLGPERPPSGALTGREASMDVPAAALFVSVLEEQPNGLLTQREDGADGRISTTRAEVEPGAPAASAAALEQTRSTLDMRLGPDGALLIERSTEARDDVFTVFEPALVAMPGALEAGVAHTQAFRMVVHPIAAPGKVKTQGEARQTIVYEADQTVGTPAGTFECRRVLTIFEADLGPARVEVLTRSWYAPRVGLVAETIDERVWTLGILFRSRSEGWALASLRPGVSPPAPLDGAAYKQRPNHPVRNPQRGA